jgi:hypothetical protein
MPEHRPAVPTDVKKQLINETGGKCANPGCPNTRTQLHHIHEWAAYGVHDAEWMIAVCPACHDAIHHHKTLKITDDELQAWKDFSRIAVASDHIYVEPGEDARLVVGNLSLSGLGEVNVLKLGSQHLRIGLVERRTLTVDLRIDDLGGNKVVWGESGHVFWDPAEITVDRRQGRLSITTDNTERHLPLWFRERIEQQSKQKGAPPPPRQLPLIDVSVPRPAVIHIVSATWSTPETVLVIGQKGVLTFCERELEPQFLTGDPTILINALAPEGQHFLNSLGLV